MEYRTLGRSGLKVSPLCLGTDNFANPTPEDECVLMIKAALDAGINFIDTSNSYVKGECERIIGRALSKNKRRHHVVIATKVYYPTGPGPNDQGGSRRHIIKACEDSLGRLQTDYIDLYQTHRPSLDIPIDETLGSFDGFGPPRESSLYRQLNRSRLESNGSGSGQRDEGLRSVHL